MNEKLALGVDGGGTKTVAWLARTTPAGELEVLGRGSAGSSNLRAVGRDKALENLSLSIDSAWSDSGREVGSVEAAVLALAGAGQADVQTQVLDWAHRRGVAKKVQVVHDARAVLQAGTPAAWGVALVAGTGAVAFALDASGRDAIAGGWGFWFGDEGSAFWLGQAALRVVTQAADGRGPATLLTRAILERLEITDPREILLALSRAGDERRGIAALADLVIDTAEEQDAMAVDIVNQAVVHLATLVLSAAEKLSLGQQFPLALAGGVLCGSSLVRERLTQELLNGGICPSSLELVSEPVLGCLKLACGEVSAG